VLPAISFENTTTGQLFAGPAISSLASAHPPADFVQAQASARAERAAAKAAEAAAARDDDSPSLEHILEGEGEEEALDWVEVPHAPVAEFLRGVLQGRLQPVKTLPTAGKAATPTPLAPRPTGHTEL